MKSFLTHFFHDKKREVKRPLSFYIFEKYLGYKTHLKFSAAADIGKDILLKRKKKSGKTYKVITILKKR